MAISILASLSNLAGITKGYVNKSQSAIGEVFIDCTESEVIEYTRTSTDHPIENGSSITDHSYLNALKVKVQGSMVDTPLDIVGVAQKVTGVFTGGNILSNIKETFIGKGRKQTTAYEALQDLVVSGRTVTLVSYLDTFEDMIVESAIFPRDINTGARLKFEVILKKITEAEVLLVNISSSTKDIVNKKVKLGSQTSKPVTDEVKKKNISIAYKNFYEKKPVKK